MQVSSACMGWFVSEMETLMAETAFGKIPVSVVIPCYRCAGTIERAVDSVLAQKQLPMELILVEDFSGDGTLGVLKKLQSNSPELIKVIQLKVNCGAASARNFGWDASTQPYITFLDADDSWHPEKLKLQFGYMEQHPEISVSGHLCGLFGSDTHFLTLGCTLNVVPITPINLVFRNYFSTPTVMLRKDLPLRFEHGRRYAEDLQLWQLIAFAGYQIVKIQLPLAYLHKAAYGEAGLSSNHWEMEKGELKNIVQLYKAGHIRKLVFLTALVFSLLKFIRRIIKSYSTNTFRNVFG